jgi:MFS family permease
MVLFEVPTGIVADTVGRRRSYLLGTVTLSASTLLYVLLWQLGAPFWQWAGASLLLGLGFTFFSGAVEAWLVDALTATGFKGDMESVFGRGQIVAGGAMLGGSLAGGFIAQHAGLGVPFVLRGLILAVMFGVAFKLMHDVGFAPTKGGRPLAEMRRIASASIEHGWHVPAVKWLMVEALFIGGVGIYAFYALQPYLLELYGDPHAYQIAGLVAAIVAGAQILGGLAAPHIRRLFHRRTSALIATAGLSAVTLGAIGAVESFWAVIALISVWGLLWAATMPIRQAYLNDLIPSSERATILSFDSLMTSSGGVWTQPALGRAADAWGYAPTYLISAAVTTLALPFLALSRRENAPADTPAPAGGLHAAPQPA